MDIVEASLVILISVILSGLATYAVLRYYLMRLNVKPFIRFAKQYASQMGYKGAESRASVKQQKTAVEAKRKVAEAAIEELPMGGVLKRVIERAGLSGEEIFSLIQDQSFMRGVQVIISTFSGIADKLTGKEKQKDFNNNEVRGYIGQG